MNNKINYIKYKIDEIIDKGDLIFYEKYYDGEDEDDNNKMWYYDFIIYDKLSKIKKVKAQINKYAKTFLEYNENDGDYLLECTIK